jgi:hypothetical protein
MREDTEWKVIAGIGLVTLSLALYTAHYLVFQDQQHLFLFLLGDLAFLPIEILVVTIIIEQMLVSRDMRMRTEKLNILIGMFFSRFGTRLLSNLSRDDPGIARIREKLVITEGWTPEQFRAVQSFFRTHSCEISGDRIDLVSLKQFLSGNEEFVMRIIENPMVFEHEAFTDLILAVSHLTEELKAREDLAALPPSDRSHLRADICRVYERLIPEWLKYMEYLKDHYPYLFSLSMRSNPFDPGASVIVG